MTERRAEEVVRRLVGETTPDAELLALYRDYRDESAFAELVRRHLRAVRGAAARVLRTQADIDDTIQAAFLVLLQRIGTLDARFGIGPWLYGVAHRIAVRVLQRQRRTVALAGEGPAAPDRPCELSWREACGVLHEELDRLPERYRLPVMLCYLEGQTRDEAARALGLSAGSTKGRVQRGLARLRRRLVRRGVALSAGVLAAASEATSVSAVALELTAPALRAPSQRVAELAKEGSVRTTMWKWVAGAASLLVLGGGAVLAAVLTAVDRPDQKPPKQTPAAPEPVRVPVDPPRPVKVKPELICTSKEDSGLSTVAFGPGGKVIVTGGSSAAGPDHGTVRLRDPATGKPTATFPFPWGVEAVALSPDGKQLAIGTGGLFQGPRAKPYNFAPGRLAVLSFPAGKEVFALKGGSSSYPALAFSADGKLLAVGGGPSDDTGAPLDVTPVVIWDPATGKRKVALKGQPGYIRGVAFSPDGKTLAVVSVVPRERPGQAGFGHAHLWDVQSGKDLLELKGDGGPIWHVAFAPSGKLVVTGGVDGNARLWDPATGKELARLKSGAPVVSALAFSPDGRLLAVGGGDPGDAAAPGVLRIWDVEMRKELAELRGHETTVRGLAFSPDGARLAVGEIRGALSVWSLGNQ
jgi:RNA polymerase sigma factor (sigma-70 family)